MHDPTARHARAWTLRRQDAGIYAALYRAKWDSVCLLWSSWHCEAEMVKGARFENDVELLVLVVTERSEIPRLTLRRFRQEIAAHQRRR